MVVELRGFRGRWLSSSAAASAADLGADADDVSFGDASNQWDTVDAPNDSCLFGSAACDFDDNVSMDIEPDLERFEETEPQFMRHDTQEVGGQALSCVLRDKSVA